MKTPVFCSFEMCGVFEDLLGDWLRFFGLSWDPKCLKGCPQESPASQRLQFATPKLGHGWSWFSLLTWPFWGISPCWDKAKSCVNPKLIGIVEIPWHSQNILRKIQKKQAAGDFPKQNDLFLWAKWSPNLIHRYTFSQRRAVILNPLVVSIDATSRPTTQSSKLQILLTGGSVRIPG